MHSSNSSEDLLLILKLMPLVSFDPTTVKVRHAELDRKSQMRRLSSVTVFAFTHAASKSLLMVVGFVRLANEMVRLFSDTLQAGLKDALKE